MDEIIKEPFTKVIMLDLIFPVVPIVFEYVANGNNINEKSLSIFMAIYILCIGLQSKWQFTYFASILGALVFSFLYGLSYRLPETGQVVYDSKKLYGFPAILIAFIVFFGVFFTERLKRYI